MIFKIKYFIHHLNKLLIEIISYFAYYLFKKSERRHKKKVIIFAQGRTGSTLLENLICSSGYFIKNGELLSKLNTPFRKGARFPLQYLKGRAILSNGNFIVHIKIYQLSPKNFTPNFFLRSLYDDGWHIIYLKRENKVMHAMSNIFAEQRNHYHKLDDLKENRTININCSSFLQRVENRVKYEKEEQKALKNIPHYKVIYEDDLEYPEKHQHTLNKIFKYLSLSPRQVYTDYRKINKKPLRQSIANFQEFHACLKKRNLLHYIEDK